MKEKIDVEEKDCTEYLECVLTEKELIQKSKDLAKANEDLADAEARKKDIMADFTAQQKKHEANIGILSRIVSSGKEYRDVKCKTIIDYTKGTKVVKRLDTFEIVKERDLTQQERQQNLEAA